MRQNDALLLFKVTFCCDAGLKARRTQHAAQIQGEFKTAKSSQSDKGSIFKSSLERYGKRHHPYTRPHYSEK